MLVKAIEVVVLSGVGSIGGILVGGLIIGAIDGILPLFTRRRCLPGGRTRYNHSAPAAKAPGFIWSRGDVDYGGETIRSKWIDQVVSAGRSGTCPGRSSVSGKVRLLFAHLYPRVRVCNCHVQSSNHSYFGSNVNGTCRLYGNRRIHLRPTRKGVGLDAVAHYAFRGVGHYDSRHTRRFSVFTAENVLFLHGQPPVRDSHNRRQHDIWQYTGGYYGLNSVPPLFATASVPYYFFFLALMVLSLLVLHRFESCRIGTSLKAVAQSRKWRQVSGSMRQAIECLPLP